MVGADRRRNHGGFEVHYLFGHERENWFLHVTVAVAAGQPEIPSLATFHYPASRFEREIFDLFGIRARGHPDPRPLVRHAFWPEDYFPLRKDAAPRDFHDDGQAFPFQQVGGEGVYEIPVGPVHAGIIEPGHFRFSVVGETIIDMKSRLYFTHKGTEKLFEGRTPDEGVELAERVSGDTSVGHALAYCQAAEALTGTVVPPRARYLRVILLELERLYNHVGDFGMIANDTGFAVAHSHCFRIRERLLRLNKRLTGHRLLRGALSPGGVRTDLPRGLDVVSEVQERAGGLRRDRRDQPRQHAGGRSTRGDRPADAPDRARSRRPRLRGARVRAGRRRPPRPSVRGVRGAVVQSARVRLGRREGAHASPSSGGAGVGEADPAGGGRAAGRAARLAPGPLPGLRAGVRPGRGMAGADHSLADDRRRAAGWSASRSSTHRS